MKKTVLVMCTGNSFRSQMAEGYLRLFGGDQTEVFSAGVKANGKVSPWAIKLMAQDGIDITGHQSHQAEIYLDHSWDYIITVCDNAQSKCPQFPRLVGKKFHQQFADFDSKMEMSEEETMNHLIPIRDAIKAYCQDFIQTEIKG